MAASLTLIDVSAGWQCFRLRTDVTKIGFSSVNDIVLRRSLEEGPPPGDLDLVMTLTQREEELHHHYVLSWPLGSNMEANGKLIRNHVDCSVLMDIGLKLRDGDSFVVTCGRECGPYWFTFKHPPSSDVSSEVAENCHSLPKEMWRMVFQHLSPVDLIQSVAPVCTRFFDLVSSGVGRRSLQLDRKTAKRYEFGAVGQPLPPSACLSFAVVCGPTLVRLILDCDAVGFDVVELVIEHCKNNLQDLELVFKEGRGWWERLAVVLTSVFAAGKLKRLKLPCSEYLTSNVAALRNSGMGRCESLEKVVLVCDGEPHQVDGRAVLAAVSVRWLFPSSASVKIMTVQRPLTSRFDEYLEKQPWWIGEERYPVLIH